MEFRCTLFEIVIWNASVSAVFIFNQRFCHNRLLIMKIAFDQYVLFCINYFFFAQTPHLRW